MSTCQAHELCTPSRYEAEYWTMPHTFHQGRCSYCGEAPPMHEEDPITACVGGDAGKYAMCDRPSSSEARLLAGDIVEPS